MPTHCLLLLACLSILTTEARASESGTSPEEAKVFFEKRGKTVLTFVGYSGSGYEKEEEMLSRAGEILDSYSTEQTIVNIGATIDGIGAIYALAKKKGFETTGIVSIQAKKYEAEISPYVDTTFFIEDETWGGYSKDGKTLNPTSQAIVSCSDVVIGIGGGEVARDELLASKNAGKTVHFHPAEFNHAKAIEKARSKGNPIPTDFRGAASAAFRAKR